MEYLGHFIRLAARAQRSRERAKRLIEKTPEIVKKSEERVEAGRDLLRERVRGLPPG